MLTVGILIGTALVRWVEVGQESAVLAQSEGKPASSLFGPVVERVLPAVVSIDVDKRFRHGDLMRNHPPIQGDGESDLQDEEFEIPSSGSGFVIDPQGYILTNDHVVRDAIRIQVLFADRTRYPARLIGRDPMTDLAVLQIEPRGKLPSVPLADSDRCRIGDWVVAIGNPLGMLQGSVTFGIISGKGRSEIAIRGGSPSYQDFIQTDASINPGNSGGPLVNGRGEAVGINTAFNGPGTGIGFAISMNLARSVAEQLIAKGRVPRGFLGIGLQTMDQDLARGWGMPDQRGVLVTEVQEGTPAADAGLQKGDLIVEFAEMPVTEVQPFRVLVAETEIGRPMKIRFLREGESREAEVRLIERSDPIPILPEPESVEESEDLGLFVSALPEGDRGVRVDSVRIDSPAFRSGVRSGDRIVAVGWSEIVTPEQFREIGERHLRERGALSLEIARGEGTAFLSVRPS